MDETARDPRAAIGAAPIPGDAPAGSNIRYEPDFTELQAKVSRMDTEGPLAVNWKEVAEEAGGLLQTRSKDLLLAAWVTLALARTESWHGLATGLQITEGMIDAFWPDLEPPAKRERARVQMLEWTVGRVVPLFEEVKPAEAAWPDVLAAYEALARIEQLLDEKLTKESAALGDLTRLLRERARVIEREMQSRAAAAKAAEDAAAAAPAPEPAAPPPAPVAAVQAVAAPPPVATPTNAGDIDLALTRLQRSMQEVARGVQAADPTDPRGYVLLREAVWLTVSQAPMSTNGVTPLPPPPQERVAYLAGLQQSGDHNAAIDGIEQTLTGAPFWLAAHRMTALSLGALGDRFAAARMGVVAATASLLRRLPVLLELSFNDNAPLADPDTLAWVKAEVLTGNGGGEASADPLDAAVRAARAAANTAGPKAALAVFTAGMAGLGGRARFRWQLAQAAFCTDFGLVALALSLLDSLDAEVTRAGLEIWEPELAAAVSSVAHRCLLLNEAQSLRAEDVRIKQLEWHRARLCRIDIVAAAEALQLS